MVSSMVRNLLRAWGAVARADVSNACATSPSVRHDRRFVVAVQMLAAIALTAELGAQGPDRPSDPSRDTQSVQPATAALAQCLAVDMLAGDVADVFVHADVEQRHDVGVIEQRRATRLALEVPELALLGIIVPQELERDLAMNDGVLGQIDRSGGTFPQAFEDAIAPDP